MWACARDSGTYRICANASNKRPCCTDRGLKFIVSLHSHPHFVYASSEGSGESAHMRRLTRTLAALRTDKYRKLALAHMHVSYNAKQTVHLYAEFHPVGR